MEEKVGEVQSMSGKAKLDWLKIGIAAGILAAIILGIIWIASLSKSSNLSVGDTVQFKYTIEFSDGTKISNSTNLKIGSIAETFGFATNKIDTLIGNLSLGSKKTVTLLAEDAFGPRDEANFIIVNRTVETNRLGEQNRTLTVPLADAQAAFGTNLTLNKKYSISNDPLQYTVLSITNSDVKLRREADVGKTTQIDAVFSMTIMQVSDEKIVSRIDAKDQIVNTSSGSITITSDENKIYRKITPAIGQQVAYRYSLATVKSLNETSIVLDLNDIYAGKSVTITLEAVKIISQVAKPSSDKTIDQSTCYGKYGISKGTVVFVHSNTCPHCQNVKPIVQELKNQGYSFYLAESQDADAQKVVNECFGDVLSGYIPQFICVNNKKENTGEMSQSELQAFADECRTAESVAAQPAAGGIKVTGIADAKFSISDQEVCTENGKPIVYFFGADFCPHCKWEHPIFNETVMKFKDYVSFHDNMGTQNDNNIFTKFNPKGTIPTMVIGCKYFRVGTTGDETDAGKIVEQAALTKLLCDVTGNKPADLCK
jgi:FKBP-type peptidyl-prolyl cis-trans isomerase 2/glutaredoxin